jgi:hypothetical protein
MYRIINLQGCYIVVMPTLQQGIRGAMVARLTPDQKVACSIHVGFKTPISSGFFFSFYRHLSISDDGVKKKNKWYFSLAVKNSASSTVKNFKVTLTV